MPRALYRGQVIVAVTARIADRQPVFADSDIVHVFVELLKIAADKHSGRVPIYCFMPDHVHVVLEGQTSGADTWRSMVTFKQQSGLWLSRHVGARWQKDFFDHIIRADEDVAAQIRYVANNPVRKGLVSDWRSYPFTGAIGYDLHAVIDRATT
ncbi:MAG: transposase [Deltaproteobacteria bacterium]|nr:transposase [Deltaproteobacteria bacterium]MBI3391015.1 transposase [Deltaproteobacteria bacterium]